MLADGDGVDAEAEADARGGLCGRVGEGDFGPVLAPLLGQLDEVLQALAAAVGLHLRQRGQDATVEVVVLELPPFGLPLI